MLFHGDWTHAPNSAHLSTECKCMTSQIETLFAPAAQQFTVHLITTNNVHVVFWADHWWNPVWLDNPTRLRTFIPDTDTHPPGVTFPRTAWVWLNCLRTGVRCFCSYLHKWNMTSSAACECGAEEQTVDHVVFQCPIHRPPHRLHGLMVVDIRTIEWLLNTWPKI